MNTCFTQITGDFVDLFNLIVYVMGTKHYQK